MCLCETAAAATDCSSPECCVEETTHLPSSVVKRLVEYEKSRSRSRLRSTGGRGYGEIKPGSQPLKCHERKNQKMGQAGALVEPAATEGSDVGLTVHIEFDDQN